MSVGLRLFTTMHRFRRMQLAERLEMLPRSEHMILEMLISCAECGRAGEVHSTARLAEKMHVSAPAVSRTLRSLRKRGLIEMEPDEADRRNTCIRATKAGHDVIAADRARLDALLDRAAARLTPGELDQFFTTFERLCDAVSDELDILSEKNKDER